ncbi:MAG: VTT domain-containing protein, partial [Planctomycetes bacterium]|nr:VTT domain-containing protein [Planctomycetota bacterium]
MVLTLAAGAIFGLWRGSVIVSISSTAGATLAFLASRYVLGDAVRRRFGERLRAIDDGLRRDGAFYLVTLRLIAVIPFFVVNLAMGLTAIPVRTYALASWIGMIPGTILYVNAGTRLGELNSLKGILSPAVLGSFLLLAAFPWIVRAAIAWWRRRRALAGRRAPRRFDYDLVVIGAGSGGLVAASIGAALHAKV